MFRNYLKVAFRNLMKRKGFTLINILGLATGMTVCILIVLFVSDELSYDNFQTNGDRLYRVALDRIYPGRSTSYAIIPISIGDAIRHEFPEVAENTRLLSLTNNGSMFLKAGDKVFEERNAFIADSNFFHLFTCHLLAGDTATALLKPNSAVLNETLAVKLFGSASAAMGKVFETDGNAKYEVSGVCKDWPDNSHMSFDLLLSASSFPFTRQPDYIGFSTYTYLLLKPNASAAGLEAKLPKIVEKYVSGQIARNFGQTYQQFLTAGNGYRYYLQPVRRIHLISDLEAEIRPNWSMHAVYIFSIIAAFILLLACINFINLSTARSVERAREVGIRKTFGSEKKSLIAQFLQESILVSLFSTILSVIMIALLLPLFNRVAGKSLSLFLLLDPAKIILLLLFGIAVGLIAGLYPAFVLSSFQPIKVLKGKFQSNKYGTALRNGLVIFQFAISIILIICTIIVNRQMNYMLGDKLGFRKDHIIEIERTDLLGPKSKAFRAELARTPGVESVSGASIFPGGQGFFGISYQPEGTHQTMIGRGIIVDDQFASLLGLKLKEGRFFSSEYSTDSLSVVLNEKAVSALGLHEPVVGSRLVTADAFLNAPDGSPYVYKVVGVVNDFHYQTLHQTIAPLVITNAAKFGEVTPLTSVRIHGEDFKSAISAIEHTWRSFVSERPFHYTFLDQNLAAQYKAEQTLQKIFTIFSALAIFIACIGLLGLAAYATQQRIREIGIRKILGASVPNIIRMLSLDFMKLVAVSALIAFPIAWLAMHAWLDGFVYRVDIGWWVFVLAGIISVIISLLTISYQAIKAAVSNPIKILRSE